jgi:hypothetical protein
VLKDNIFYNQLLVQQCTGANRNVKAARVQDGIARGWNNFDLAEPDFAVQQQGEPSDMHRPAFVNKNAVGLAGNEFVYYWQVYGNEQQKYQNKQR